MSLGSWRGEKEKERPGRIGFVNKKTECSIIEAQAGRQAWSFKAWHFIVHYSSRVYEAPLFEIREKKTQHCIDRQAWVEL